MVGTKELTGKQKLGRGSIGIILVIGLLNGLMPFTTDLYLPAFSVMAESLNTTVGFIAMTMSTFFAGSCIGQIAAGPILDKFGRKNPMMIGLVLFLVTSIGCAWAPFIEVLLGLRFFQAVGISMCNVGGKTVVRDLFYPEDTARIFSLIGLVMGIAPIIAPSVGAVMLVNFGWESIFYFLGIFSFLLIILLYYFLPYTGKSTTAYSLSFSNVFNNYKKVVSNKIYLSYTLVTALTSAVLFSWITNSSFIFIELLGMTEKQFGLVFACTAGCMVIASQVNYLLLRKFKPSEIAFVAIIADVILSIYLYYLVNTEFTSLSLILNMCAILFFLTMISINGLSIGLNQIEEDLGVATAFMGSLRMGLSALVTFIVSYFLVDSAVPMAIAILVMSVISLILQYKFKQALV